MGERTGYEPGTFSWTDLATSDADAAKQFYSGLFGWAFEDLPVGEGSVYTMCRIDGKDVAVISAQPETERSQGLPPHWNSYVTVDDLEERAASVDRLGGRLVMPPFDVMSAGRMALLSDPTGGYLAMWQAKDNIGAGLVNVPGALTWNDLATGDPAAAKRFYGELFGWTFEELEGSPVPYAVIRNGETTNGGIRAQVDQEKGSPAYWVPYFAVESCDESAAKATDLGGSVIAPTTQVPNGAFAAIMDPQGAAFSVFHGELDP